ncbi:uncharacterized protein LOC119669015 [Teleopsis dalmanni]|uniref:uncharacterized protein LOC119669015 n=1 Tax=Teleopsis dalmanni TaxID=139649 RepID=UPI0018CCDC42|nr:uncharacterized protein LOC119669015 [Teleopsis dalmanni]
MKCFSSLTIFSTIFIVCMTIQIIYARPNDLAAKLEKLLRDPENDDKFNEIGAFEEEKNYSYEGSGYSPTNSPINVVTPRFYTTKEPTTESTLRVDFSSQRQRMFTLLSSMFAYMMASLQFFN